MKIDRKDKVIDSGSKELSSELKAFSIKKKHSKKYIELIEALENSKNIFESSQRSELKLLNCTFFKIMILF
jgi:hypothetical protein